MYVRNFSRPQIIFPNNKDVLAMIENLFSKIKSNDQTEIISHYSCDQCEIKVKHLGILITPVKQDNAKLSN